MAKLILLRHLKSQWNHDNRFAGWTDGPLAKDNVTKAQELAEKISQVDFDKAYSSVLFRNMDTIARIFEYIPNKYPMFVHLDGGKMQEWANYENKSLNEVVVYVSEKLNERYYGKLQGLNKEEIIKQYGAEKVHLWRRGFKETPPGGESLKDVCNRAVPFYKKYIEKDLKKNKNILIIASHNSLRAIVKCIEEISDQNIANVELPFGALLEYEIDENAKLTSKKYFS